MIVQVTRDIAFGDRVLIREGAVRVVSHYDVVTNSWAADGSTTQALYVETDLDDGSHVALESGDYVVLPVKATDDLIPFLGL